MILVGDSSWHGHRLAAQHIAEGLTRYAEVLYVDPPLSPVGLRRLHRNYDVERWVGLETLDAEAGLHRFGALVPPGKTWRVGRRLTELGLRLQLRRAVRAIGSPVHAIIQIPPHFPVLDAFDTSHRVHLASDDFVAAAEQNRVDRDWVIHAEERIGHMATGVIAVSQPLVDRWRARGQQAVLIPNGCDLELFASTDNAEPPADVHLDGPIAGFIGTISARTDVALLEALANRGRNVLLVGPRSFTAPNDAFDSLITRPNVQWVGSKHHRELPSYLRVMDVGLVPYHLNDFNAASFPLKTLDYLAAGLPVVSTALDGVRVVGEDVVTVAADDASWVAAVEAHLDAPSSPDDVVRRRARAGEHSWDARVAEIATVVGLADVPPRFGSAGDAAGAGGVAPQPATDAAAEQ